MITLRKHKSGDEPAIMALIQRVLNSYGLDVNPEETDSDIQDIQATYIDGGGIFKVIVSDGEIVGSYGIFKIDNETCELRKMYLEKSFQGQGLGKQMMDDALEQACKLGFLVMVLETNSMLKEAIGLYRKYGFEEYEPEHLSDRCDAGMRKVL